MCYLHPLTRQVITEYIRSNYKISYTSTDYTEIDILLTTQDLLII